MKALRLTEQELLVIQNRRAAGRVPSRPPTPSKHKNIPTVVDGIRFASQKEAKRWGELKLLEKAGEISNLKRQVAYDLYVKGMKITRYVADFAYDSKAGVPIVEDVKGQKRGVPYTLFKIKKELMLALHGIEVREI